MANFLANAPKVYVQTGQEQSRLFAMNFARNVRHHVVRLTGGCGLMSKQDAIGLEILADALSGRSDDGTVNPRASGFFLYGGTRMLKTDMPSVIIPGITEVPSAVAPYCPGAVFLGVIAKVHDLKITPHGMVVAEDDKGQHFTIINPEQQSCLLLQPNADKPAIWLDEALECNRIINSLHEHKWASTLIAYNGGDIVRQELDIWAANGLNEPGKWNVLLIKGSGRTTDKYANDQAWLDAHPHVHVANLDVADIREKLVKLDVLKMPSTPVVIG